MGLGYVLLFFFLSYCWATPSYAYVIRHFYKVDILVKGSGNPGATNVFRECGKMAGIVCFFLDFQKGFVPVLFFSNVIGVLGKSPFEAASYELTCLSFWAFGCILGHVFTPWLKFKGGKGVATAAGCFCAFYPLFTFVFILSTVLFFLIVNITRYISLASIITSISIPVFIIIIGFILFQVHKTKDLSSSVLEHDVASICGDFYFVIKHLIGPISFGTVLSGLIVCRHWGNLGRIIRNQEPKFDNSL